MTTHDIIAAFYQAKNTAQDQAITEEAQVPHILTEPNQQDTHLAESKLRDFRMACAALWQISLPNEIRPVFIED